VLDNVIRQLENAVVLARSSLNERGVVSNANLWGEGGTTYMSMIAHHFRTQEEAHAVAAERAKGIREMCLQTSRGKTYTVPLGAPYMTDWSDGEDVLLTYTLDEWALKLYIMVYYSL
jgi:hypothetical protein